MSKKDDALKLARVVINDTAYGAPVFRQEVRDVLVVIDEALAEQPARQQEPIRVPVTDNTYGYAKSLAEAIFKQHFASDEHYASGRIVWGVNDTVIGILTQIDNMVADMVRRPAQQQEPVAVYVGETWCGSVVRLYDDLPLETPLYTSPQPSKPWVGLSTSDLDKIDAPIRERGSATIAEIYQAIEAKLRDKNAQPPKPLTNAQIAAVAAEIWGSILIAPQSYQAFARAIEAEHGIKENT